MSSSGFDLRGPIKLVIWDLDETFWKGTLSEEGMELAQAHVDTVLALSARGIVNSICSKNDAAAVETAMKGCEAWGHFVFPQIHWAAKGPIISSLIQEMQLRPPNVLFIDDNEMNLQEARHYAEGLQVATPDIIPHLLDLEALAGKPDPEYSRRDQYKLLERRSSDLKTSGLSNETFLYQSGIEVSLHDVLEEDFDRIFELISRTNQLNFTKKRIERSELRALIDDRDAECGYLRVRDRYGDYGICGFFALRDGALDHFLFSCRILHMGIEQWLYARLGEPAVEVAGEVSSSLCADSPVTWVTEVREVRPSAQEDEAESGTRIFFKGGCDLEQVMLFLGASNTVVTELNTVLDNGHPHHTEHTEILRRCAPETLSQHGDVIDRIPFIERSGFVTQLFDTCHQVVVYSVLMDYSQGLYRYRDTDFVLPYSDYEFDATQESEYRKLERARDFPGDFFPWFTRNFHFEGRLSPERFVESLHWLRGRLAEETLLILLNGSEVAVGHDLESGRGDHHRAMNRAMEDAIHSMPNTVICDVRESVTRPEDLMGNIRHYQRRCYLKIAEQLAELVKKHGGVEFVKASRFEQVSAQAAHFFSRAMSAFKKRLSRRQ